MSNRNPTSASRPRPRVRSSLSVAAAVVWSVLWVVVGGCGKKAGQEVVPGTIDTLSVISDTNNDKRDGKTYKEQPKDDMSASATRDNADSRLVIMPRGVWTANLGGNVAFHYVAITFLPNNSFIYRDACTDGCKEVDSDGEWEKIDGTIGRWYTESNKLTVVFSDGYKVTVPYTVTDEELNLNFENNFNERLGSGEGVLGTYRKERY